LKSFTNGPVLIYDDKCSSCTVFAKYAFKYSRGQINCIGHYSKEGEKLKKTIFPPNYNETEMFWMITSNNAYGGRSGLLPLLGFIIRSIFKPNKFPNVNFAGYCSDSQLCSDKKFQIKRLYNLLKHGKRLNIKYTKTIND
jgi:hypothetical protein